MKKNIIIPSISLFVICTVAALLLAFTNQATAQKIEQLAAENAKASQAKVLETATSFEDKEITVDGKAYTYQIGKNDSSEIVGYVVTTTANGYGGQVKIMTGILPDGKVNKIEVLDVSSETPGLGLNASNESFHSQFKGKSAGITVSKNSAEGNSIKAMTGATITSTAVTNAVNTALTVYENIVGGETSGK